MESSLLLCFVASSLFLLPISAQSATPADHVQNFTDQTDVNAVKYIFKVWNIEDWKTYYADDPCNGTDGSPWPHLTCDCSRSQPCRIVTLNLTGKNIEGEIPAALFDLPMLTFLDLSKNLLFGKVPQEIRNLTNLKHLDLSINLLTGTLDVLNPLMNLTYLSFGSNNFTGSLPSLGKPNLVKELYFDSSGVSEFDAIRSYLELEKLWAFDNPLTGNLTSVENLKNLTDLRIYGTNIHGPIPTSFGSLRYLVILMIGDLSPPETSNTNSTPNALSPPERSNTNSPPDSVFSFLNNMTNLTVLSLRNCSLVEETGLSIPPLPKLEYLDLSSNFLSGSVPASFKKTQFPALKQLFLGGGNKLSGDLSDFMSSNLTVLDVSFNDISGVLSGYPKIHINYLGTSIVPSSSNSNISEILRSIRENSSIRHIRNFTSNDYIAIKCGGDVQNSQNIFYYNTDTYSLGAADLRVDPNNLWVVSNSAFSPPNVTTSNNYIVSTNSYISGTNEMDMLLYQTARISQSSLSYYVVGLPNADNYTVELHFAEIIIEDPNTSWTGLGKRLFNIKILDNVTKDFNIVHQANGSNRACIQPYHNVKVTNGYIDIQLLWAGRGTYHIPKNGTYGPLISAIRIYQGMIPPPIPQKVTPLKKQGKDRNAGIVVGILSLGIASILITSSVLFLWWEWIKIGQEVKP